MTPRGVKSVHETRNIVEILLVLDAAEAAKHMQQLFFFFITCTINLVQKSTVLLIHNITLYTAIFQKKKTG